MTDKKHGNETALMIEGLYNGISYDLKVLKKELKEEFKYSSVQMGSAYKALEEASNSILSKQGGTNTSIDSVKKSLSDLQDWLTNSVEQTRKVIREGAELSSTELKFGYQQNQMIYEALTATMKEDLGQKISAIEEKLDSIEKLEGLAKALDETLKALEERQNPEYDAIAETLKEKVVSAFPLLDVVDYDKIADTMAEKSEACASLHTKEVLDAVSAIPVAENIDYTRIIEEVSDKVLEKVTDYLATEFNKEKLAHLFPAHAEIDYDKVVYGTAEKVVESLPYPEKIDYSRIPTLSEDALVEKLTASLLAKIPQPEPIDYDLLAEKVAQKIALPQQEAPTYDVLLDETGVDMIANAVCEKLQVVEVREVLVEEEPVVEEPVVEEPVVEEVVETPAPVETEIAVAADFPKDIDYDDINQLVDAETGMVLRLKRSFTAKLRQSSPDVKTYYSMLKNALDEYKRLNSNISWHCDRFNYGRDTVAKISINGKTLCFYIALDPNSEEFKQTVYHQKDVGAQKAYESTPFMMKIKSETGAKKAIRLVARLAEKLEALKDETHQDVDYQEAFAYASTKELIDEGLIKVTKEKKVDLNFK